MSPKKKVADLKRKPVSRKKAEAVKGGSIIKKRDELQRSILRRM